MSCIAYLDNSSTTKPCQRAIEYVTEALANNWGNPSSLHQMGMNAEVAVSSTREAVAKFIHAREDEIIFTGSGTEANNTALLSVLKAKKRGGRIITSATEHPSVLETVKRLECDGFEVVILPPNSDGTISLESLKTALTPNTLLVSLMLVNNETGAVNPIDEAVKLVKQTVPGAVFHCDAVQGFGKVSINVTKLGIDLLSASGHKIHGPKGIGFLYRKKSISIPPFITGGGQERGLRSGTEAVPLIMGLKGAIEDLPDITKQLEKQKSLNLYCKDLLSKLDNICFNSTDNCLPYILNISVLGYRSEILLHFLEQQGVYVSSGSACAKGNGSYVLNSMKLEKARVDSALRISFSKYNTKEDVEKLVSSLSLAQKQLRKAY